LVEPPGRGTATGRRTQIESENAAGLSYFFALSPERDQAADAQ
jgi:hypothetical protein